MVPDNVCVVKVCYPCCIWRETVHYCHVQVHEVFVSVWMREAQTEHAGRATVRCRRQSAWRSPSQLRRRTWCRAGRLLAAAAAAVHADDCGASTPLTSAVDDARLGGHNAAAPCRRTQRSSAGGSSCRSPNERPWSRPSRSVTIASLLRHL